MANRSKGSKTKGKKPPRGRPPGVALTEEQKRLILSAIEAGGTDHVAAQAAGISPRTFRELRQRAEGRHPTRRRLPDLAEFFGAVDEAKARARLKQEIEVGRTDPKFWLTKQAPSKPGLEGWTAHLPDAPDPDDIRVPTETELGELVHSLLSASVVRLPPCPEARCKCFYHHKASS